MEEVNKKELAERLSISPQMVTKHVRSGTLDKCFTSNGKKLYFEKAAKAILNSQANPNDTLLNIFKEKDIDPAKKTITNDGLLTPENEEKLAELLCDATSSSQKVQIEKDFWLGKINRQKFLLAEGEIITIDQGKEVIDALFSPISIRLDDLHINLKNRFQGISFDAISWLSNEINEIKKSVSEYKWES